MKTFALPRCALALLGVALLSTCASSSGGGVVKTEPPVANGGPDSKTTDKEVRARLGAIRACYERGLQLNPKLSGRIVLRWTITADGTVDGVNVESDTVGEPTVAGCMKSLVGRWHFPAPAHGARDVVFPFVFGPSS